MIEHELPSWKSNFEKMIELDGVNYLFKFLWNARISKWFFTIYDSEGTELQGGTLFAVNYPLTSLNNSADIFPGEIFAIDATPSHLEAGLRELSKRVKFEYEETTDA